MVSTRRSAPFHVSMTDQLPRQPRTQPVSRHCSTYARPLLSLHKGRKPLTLLQAEREAQKIVQKARECTSETCQPPLGGGKREQSHSRNRSHKSTDTPPVETDRTKRVKDARSEAQKEIEDYRKQKEDEFQSFEKEVRPAPAPTHTHPGSYRGDRLAHTCTWVV